jgi:lipopolysaccharide/colanic/teichoic acid biosynthesis glycosyltransferase
MKRVFDVLASVVLLALLAPAFLVIMLLVRRDGGPAFYGHRRVGREGVSFFCLKFRTMVVNGDEVLKTHLAANPPAAAEWEARRKLVNDPRVTKVGQFLRKTSLDELPQLINVIRGEMSLVGPRPVVAAELQSHFCQDGSAAYLAVPPGITGLWQISGRSDTTYAQRVALDIQYVRTRSFWRDLLILLRTIPAVLLRRGAV